MTLTIGLETVELPLHEPFVISRQVITSAPVLRVTLTNRGVSGRGEAHGVSYRGETPATMRQQIAAIAPVLSAGLSRADLLDVLPAGGARAALDAALWDLEAKRDGVDPFAAAAVTARPVTTSLTIGMRDTAAYSSAARQRAGAAMLKVKVGADGPLAAIDAVRRGAPDARLIVDPNQAWDIEALKVFEPALFDLGVELLEQPIAVGAEAGLDDLTFRIPLCADELIDDVADLDHAAGRFRYVNIKLEKCGGLTAALLLADVAVERGFALMVGCMGGSSLSMAPAMVLAQRCAFVDLDGPSFLIDDILGGFRYADGVVVEPHLPALWG